MNGTGFLTLLSFLGESAGSPASRESLRYYPFQFRIAIADPLDQIRDNIFTLDGNEERVLLAMTWTARTPTAITALPTGGATWSLDRIQLVLEHEDVEQIIPEFSFDSQVYQSSTFLSLANDHSIIAYPSGAAVTPQFIQTAHGFNPLLYRIGPGGKLRIGGQKKLAAGIGEEWYIWGSIISWKTKPRF